MKRHKWNKGADLRNKVTEQHQCINCELYRFKAMGIWMYSKDKTTNGQPFVEVVSNKGCN